MSITRRLLVAAVVAAGAAAGLSAPASAAPATATPGDVADRELLVEPASGQRASGGGGRSGDFTGDGIPDILARNWNDSLQVYPNGGTFDGTATYPEAVYINAGWGGFSWIGAADLSGDGNADVVGIDDTGAMVVAEHSGTFSGLRTLENGLTLINLGWQINDLVYVFDYNGDGFDDLLARRAGTGVTYVYYNNGGITGLSTFAAPIAAFGGGNEDVFQGIGDVTLDGVPDLIYVYANGVMGAMSLGGDGDGALIGTGWQTVDRIVLTDLDGSGNTDILGRRTVDSTLQAYAHSGQWINTAGTAYGTYRAPVLVGTNWWINDIIA